MQISYLHIRSNIVAQSIVKSQILYFLNTKRGKININAKNKYKYDQDFSSSYTTNASKALFHTKVCDNSKLKIEINTHAKYKHKKIGPQLSKRQKIASSSKYTD